MGSMPDTKVRTGAVPSLLSSALEDFKYRDWHAFGSQLGKAMQQMAIVTFPQEYEVDDTGRLHRIIIETAEMGQSNHLWGKGLAIETLFGFVSVVFFIAAVFIAFRSRTRASVHEYERETLDLEAV